MRKLINAILLIISVIISFNIYNYQKRLIIKDKNELGVLNNKNILLKEAAKAEKEFLDFKNIFKSMATYEIIDTVSRLAEQAGLKINKVQPLGEEEDPLYIKSKLKLILSTTDYHTIGNFVSFLEKSPDLYKVESLSIASTEEGRMSIEIVVIRFALKG